MNITTLFLQIIVYLILMYAFYKLYKRKDKLAMAFIGVAFIFMSISLVNSFIVKIPNPTAIPEKEFHYQKQTDETVSIPEIKEENTSQKRFEQAQKEHEQQLKNFEKKE